MDEIRKEYEEYVRKVEDVLERFVRKVLLKMQRDSVKIIDDNKAIGYTQELRKNIRYEVTKQAASIIGILGVGANVPYGIYRHEGTKPHFPPIDPILKWVIYKGLAQHKKKPTTLRALQKAGADSEAKSIAFLIARKISQKGTKGLDFLKKVLEMNTDWIISQLNEIQI